MTTLRETLIIDFHASWTDDGAKIADQSVRSVQGNNEFVRRWMATAHSRLVITEHLTQTDLFDEDGPSATILRGHGKSPSRPCLVVDHRSGRTVALAPSRSDGPQLWVDRADADESLTLHVSDDAVVALGPPARFRTAPWEVEAFWETLFPGTKERGTPSELLEHGVPRELVLRDSEGRDLLRLAADCRRGEADLLDRIEIAPSRDQFAPVADDTASAERSRAVDRVHATRRTKRFFLSGPAYAEDVGLLLSEQSFDSFAPLINDVLDLGGTFGPRRNDALVFDWYPKGDALAPATANAFRWVQAILRSITASVLLPEATRGSTVPDWLREPIKTYFAGYYDPAIPADQRLCRFLAEAQPYVDDVDPKPPTEAEVVAYREGLLRDMIEDFIVHRFGRFALERPDPFVEDNDIFKFTFDEIDVHMTPGDMFLGGATTTDDGLSIRLNMASARFDGAFHLRPKATPGGIALAILTLGASALVFADEGTVRAKAKNLKMDVLLKPHELIFDREATIALGFTGKGADVDLDIYNANPINFPWILGLKLTLFLGEIIGVWEDIVVGLMSSVGTLLTGGQTPTLPALLPARLRFADAPAVKASSVRLGSTAGEAMLLGASVQPADGFVTPIQPRGPLESRETFSQTMSRRFFNNVLTHRFGAHQWTDPTPALNWRDFVEGGELPDVAEPGGPQIELPESIKRFIQGAMNRPADYQESLRYWIYEKPRIELASWSGARSADDGVGLIRWPFRFGLFRGFYRQRPRLEWMQEPGVGPVPFGGNAGPVPELGGVPGLERLPWKPEVMVTEWYPTLAAKDDHLIVSGELIMRAHVFLTDRYDFLPEFDLQYDDPQVSVQIDHRSEAINVEDAVVIDAFRALVLEHTRAFREAHPRQDRIALPFFPLLEVCNRQLPAFEPGEANGVFITDFYRIASPTDSTLLNMECDANLLRIDVRLFADLAAQIGL